MLRKRNIESALIPKSGKFKIKSYPHYVVWLRLQKIGAVLKKKMYKPLEISVPQISHKIIKFVKVDSGGMQNSISFEFGQSDLVNNTLNRFHGLNTKNVDVTIIDDVGKEVELTSTVTATNVILDMGRAVIPTGKTWTLLVEA